MKEIINLLEEKKIPYDLELIKKAFALAEKEAEGRVTVNNIKVIDHIKEVTKIVINLDVDTDLVYAAILHESLKNNKEENLEYIRKEIGEDTAIIVEDVSKLTPITYKSEDTESYRKMFMALAKDVRAIILKLADRLDNMRNIKLMPEDIKKVKAKETLEIYAPIAHRLGISQMKSELEDISFRALHEEEYKWLKKAIDQKKAERQEYIDTQMKQIKQKLDELNIEATIMGRPKHFYSIYKKMKKGNKTLEQLYDLLAIRIIVNSIKDCYTVLGIVHEMYKPMPGRFKDYISVPKTNMYQSLHTTVFGEDSKPFEIQIRTWDMHKVADYGIAAHFLYKEGKSKLSKSDMDLTFIRQTIELQKEIGESKDFLKTMKCELFGDEVFVFTPKGDIKSLPMGSTPIDFAYMIHEQIGHKMTGARVNSKIVPLSCKLQNSDVVEIITSKNSEGPSIDWLKFVKTISAKNKITSFLKKQHKEENIIRGKEMLEKEIKKVGIERELLLEPKKVEKMLEKSNFNDIDEVYENIGFASISPVKIVNRLVEEYKNNLDKEEVKKLEAEKIAKIKQKVENAKKNKNKTVGIEVEGIDNCLVKLAKCCNPIPGDDIIGYISYGKGVTVHTKDCKNAENLISSERLINVKWKNKVKSEFLVKLLIRANDRKGILADVLEALEKEKIKVTSINAKQTQDKECIMNIEINIDGVEKLQKAMKVIKKVDSVFDIRRKK